MRRQRQNDPNLDPMLTIVISSAKFVNSFEKTRYSQMIMSIVRVPNLCENAGTLVYRVYKKTVPTSLTSLSKSQKINCPLGIFLNIII